MTGRVVRGLAAGAAVLALLVAAAVLTRAQTGVASPGPLADGSTLLPNGWRIAPAGRQVAVGDLPLNLIQSPDSKYLIVTNNGLAKPSLSVVDVVSWTVQSTMTLDNAWLGLAWHPDGKRLYSAAATQNAVQEFTFADGTITLSRTIALPPLTGPAFVGSLAVSHDGKTLYVTQLFASTLSAIDIPSGQVKKTATLPAEPYAVVLSADDQTVYVSLWGGSSVERFAAGSLFVMDDIATGEHPNSMVLSNDGRRLFVACGSSSAVWVLDTFADEAIEQISVSLFPEAPPTSTPNALSLSPDGRTLAVANADDNAVAMVDVSNAGMSFVSGFIPAGWYPTGVLFSRDSKLLFVLDGRGLLPSPNLATGMDKRLVGAVSAILVPDRTALADYTRKVYALTPYNDNVRLTVPNIPLSSPIPGAVGSSSPIKHVFYVIRENRSYDQVFGDERAGNGEPKMTLFGRDVTPNAHAIAESFVLFDNFYVDADVSYTGHSFSTAAYATDVIQKIWQTTYGGRGGPYLGEGEGGPLRNAFGNLSAPSGGYLWDAAQLAKVSYRSYGEFAHFVTKPPNGSVLVKESVPGLSGAVAPGFAAFDLDIQESSRMDAWESEFHAFEQNNNLPRLSIIRLGNDHTSGTKVGAPTPRAMVADNDVALGRLVDVVSHSVYWRDSAIFVVEDDAQSGPDHVDSHRSVLLVASPFAKRGQVDHTMYSTSGVLRTIELILGLPPMSEYDAAATPLVNAFQPNANLQAFGRFGSGVPLNEINTATSYGSVVSSAMDFSDADRVPDALLNDILWHSIKGAHVPMPPPRRSVLVRSFVHAADDDDGQ